MSFCWYNSDSVRIDGRIESNQLYTVTVAVTTKCRHVLFLERLFVELPFFTVLKIIMIYLTLSLHCRQFVREVNIFFETFKFDLTLTFPIGLPRHAPVAQKIADPR